MRPFLRRPTVVAVLAASLTTAALVLSSAPALASASQEERPAGRGAPAATPVTVGATSAPGAGVACSGTVNTAVQSATAAASPSYRVPSAGVVTSFSYTAGATAGSVRALFAVPAAAAGQYTVSAKTPVQNAVAGVLNTFKVRVPVAQGALLGLSVSDPRMACGSAGTTGDTVATATADVETSSTVVASGTVVSGRANVSAVVEPDADADGFGDVSQDLCPQSARTQLACPAPQTALKDPRVSRTGLTRIKFTSSIPGSTFTCSLDGRRFKACTSPLVKQLRVGRHVIKVRATSPVGIVDRTAARTWFRVPPRG